jgi:succinate dehydrogenase hydrophobic anchor subunit
MKFSVFFGIAVLLVLDTARGRYDNCFGDSHHSSLYFVTLVGLYLAIVHMSIPDWD